MTTVERTDKVKAERIHPYIYVPEGLHEKQNFISKPSSTYCPAYSIVK
jgi:hypothetical protein